MRRTSRSYRLNAQTRMVAALLLVAATGGAAAAQSQGDAASEAPITTAEFHWPHLFSSPPEATPADASEAAVPVTPVERSAEAPATEKLEMSAPETATTSVAPEAPVAEPSTADAPKPHVLQFLDLEPKSEAVEQKASTPAPESEAAAAHTSVPEASAAEKKVAPAETTKSRLRRFFGLGGPAAGSPPSEQAVSAPETAVTHTGVSETNSVENEAPSAETAKSRLRRFFGLGETPAATSVPPAEQAASPAPDAAMGVTAPEPRRETATQPPAPAPALKNIAAPVATPQTPVKNDPLAVVPVVKAWAAPEAQASNNVWLDSAFLKSLGAEEGGITLNVRRGNSAPDIVDPLMISEAVAFALRNNFEVQASVANSKSAYWEKVGAYSMYGPSVDLRTSSGYEKSTPAGYNDSSGTRVTSDAHQRRDHTYTVRQPLIDLAVIADILANNSKEAIAKESQRDSRESIAYDTVNVYMKLMQASLSIKLANEYKGFLDELAKRMQARVEGGGATAGDLDRIKGRATAAESARIEAEGEYESDIAEFRRLTHIVPARLAIPDHLASEVPEDIDEAVQRATQNNPGYLGSLRKVDLAKASMGSSVAQLAPKVSLEYSDNYSYNAEGAAKGNPVDGVYPTQTDKRLFVVAHWSLNGGNEIAGGMSGLAKSREERFRAQDVQVRLEQAIRTSYNALNAANQRIDVLKRGVDSNTRVVKEFEDQYHNGGRSLFELLDAHEQLYNSRLNLMRVAVARAQASYLVHRQMGDLVPTLVAETQGEK